VEATKFTEVGFHGRDADQIIKDLVELAVKKQHSKLESELRMDAEKSAEDRILAALFGKLTEEDRKSWLSHLRDGILDDRVISVDVPISHSHGGVASSDPIETAIREAMSQHNTIKSVKVLQQSGGRATERKSLSVKDAKEKLIQAELETLINQDMIYQKAIFSVEQEGIVFIDEIDKICTKNHGGYTGPDASAEGVQRDLLPLIEGCTVSTRYGNIKTDYILFIASGAFHNVKPSDMLAELQGRLPVKVELKHLSEEDFVRILTEPQNNLIIQSAALLKTEGVLLEFTKDAIHEVAKVSWEVNSTIENIGARRLHTVLERVLQDINFQAPNMDKGNHVIVDAEFVRTNISEFLNKTDLSKYIL
ncbi:putative ATP-dependent hsl protease ATP-binding subunit hslU, partial [Cardiosporidium cionae]